MKTKTKKLIGISTLALGLMAILFYGCDKAFLSVSPKGYSYFQNTMTSDDDFKNIAKDVKAEADIMGANHFSYIKHLRPKMHRTPAEKQELHLILQQRIQSAAAVLKSIKENKKPQTFEDMALVYKSLGFSDGEAEKMISADKARIAHFQQFIKDNPDFANLTKDQQVELITNSLHKIRMVGRKVYHKTQDYDSDPCYIAFYACIDEAYTTLEHDYGLTLAALVGCILGSGGILTPECLATWAVVEEAIIGYYVYQTNVCSDDLDDCTG